jgi:hypothetical protein
MLTTAKRTRLAKCALRCFLRQQQAEFAHELIIASEDDLEIGCNYDGGFRVQVVKTPPGLSLPDKRNAALAHARYPWITFWDDDDWSSSFRLHETTRAIRDNPMAHIVGQPWIYFHELRSERRYTYLYRYPNDGYVVGGPMAFKKTLWEAQPFRAYETVGDEGWWMMDRYKDGAIIGQTNILYLAMLHGDNTQNKDLPRVGTSGVVLSDTYMKFLGGREAAYGLAGGELARFEEAVAETFEAATPVLG